MKSKLTTTTVPTTTAAPATEPSFTRVLKIATCPTLSGKSTLTYHVGCRDNTEVLFRIYGNSGGGFYSNDWIAVSDIERVIGKQTLVSSTSIQPVCKGKSANTAGFVLAALKQEGWVARSTENPRQYIRTLSDAFAAEVKALVASGVNLDHEQVPTSKTLPVKAAAARSQSPSNEGKAST